MAVDSIRPSTKKNLDKVQKDQAKVFERLSSGSRLNRASDDPAGLAIADALRSTVSTLGQASRNIGDVGSAIQIADGALDQIGQIGSRLKELAAQSSNGTLSDSQRTALQNEFSQLTQEVQRIAGTTEFNGKQLLNGDSITGQVGKDSTENSQITVEGADIESTISSVASQNISTQSGAQNALTAVDTFISAVSSTRGSLGGSAARLEFAGNSVAVEKENASAAESRIRDADIAEEVAKKVKNDILTKTNTAVQAQANLSQQLVLKLLG